MVAAQTSGKSRSGVALARHAAVNDMIKTIYTPEQGREWLRTLQRQTGRRAHSQSQVFCGDSVSFSSFYGRGLGRSHTQFQLVYLG